MKLFKYNFIRGYKAVLKFIWVLIGRNAGNAHNFYSKTVRRTIYATLYEIKIHYKDA
jgi:hypothetical protein